MDSHIKTGNLFLQPLRTNKKWKPVRLSLFSSSSSEDGRLEIRPVAGGGPGGDLGAGVRRHHQPLGDKKVKVIRLSELTSILRLPPNAEACPTENMSAFCVETQERTLVFAALKEECVDWVEKLRHSSSQRESSSDSSQLQMEENQIYASADEVSQFWVSIQRTEAATRCGLQGSYWLQVGQQSLLLRETQKKAVVREWPYELLRRYGSDKLVFTIEAGRRCDCGPGSFSFETQQAENIFSLIQRNIRQKTASPGPQIQDSEKVSGTSIQAHSLLPKIPDLTSRAARSQDRRSPVFCESPKTQEDSPAPITLMPLPLVPTHSVQSEAIYADPAHCPPSLRKPKPVTGLYVDPASVLPLKAPRSVEPGPARPVSSAPPPDLTPDFQDSVYSEVYDKISPNQNKLNIVPRAGKTSEEPIYTEPVSKTEKVSENREPKPDPFAHLYAQVCKTSSKASPTVGTASSTPAPPSSVTKSPKKPEEESPDDIIYENLGII